MTKETKQITEILRNKGYRFTVETVNLPYFGKAEAVIVSAEDGYGAESAFMNTGIRPGFEELTDGRFALYN